MANKSYTVLIVPERSSQVRRLSIPRRLLVQIGLVAFLLIGVGAFMSVHYMHVIAEARQNRVLKDENVMLKARVRVVQEEILRVDRTLQRIDQFTSKIQAITQLNDPERNLAIGPLSDDADAQLNDVLYSAGERIGFADEDVDSKLALRLVDSRLDQIEAQALVQEGNLRGLNEFFAEEKGLLATTPSIWPSRSRLLTSTFGIRTDPYTNRRVMHKGIDIAADHGSDLLSTADGIIIFVGNRGGYGKTIVIDHGYGVQTHYAHLSAFKTEIGQRVKRGQVIGSIGNTGRSTGSHLHYEVRLNGIPQDPEKYVLN
ncbi:M23 family metallopeptidase [Myxococcota bacterium]|nr:M23 family metallopeptidase [Myxococcota bacterium]